MEVSGQPVDYIQEVAVGISNGTQIILMEIFRGFPGPLKLDAEIVSRSRPRPLPSVYFPDCRSLIILFFDSIEPKLLTVSLNKLVGRNA
jgi:hypothetical protein